MQSATAGDSHVAFRNAKILSTPDTIHNGYAVSESDSFISTVFCAAVSDSFGSQSGVSFFWHAEALITQIAVGWAFPAARNLLSFQ